MSRRAAVRQIEITRALRAAKAAGVKARVEVDNATGRIVIIQEDGAAAPVSNPYDEWKAKRKADAGPA